MFSFVLPQVILSPLVRGANANANNANASKYNGCFTKLFRVGTTKFPALSTLFGVMATSGVLTELNGKSTG